MAIGLEEARRELKKGRKVRRLGWIEGMHLVGVEDRPYIHLKTAQGNCTMWAPSGSDARAEDWEVC